MPHKILIKMFLMKFFQSNELKTRRGCEREMMKRKKINKPHSFEGIWPDNEGQFTQRCHDVFQMRVCNVHKTLTDLLITLAIQTVSWIPIECQKYKWLQRHRKRPSLCALCCRDNWFSFCHYPWVPKGGQKLGSDSLQCQGNRKRLWGISQGDLNTVSKQKIN